MSLWKKDEKIIETCGTCAFYAKGQCRRYPPTVTRCTALRESDLHTSRPEVAKTDYCGEWKSVN